MSTGVESSNKQHTMSNSSACVSVFSHNKDLTWLTTSARFMAVEWMMLPWSHQRHTRGSGCSDISHGGNQRLHWPNNFCTMQLHNPAVLASMTLNFQPDQVCHDFGGAEFNYCNLLASSKTQSNNEEWECNNNIVGVFFHFGKVTNEICILLTTEDVRNTVFNLHFLLRM